MLSYSKEISKFYHNCVQISRIFAHDHVHVHLQMYIDVRHYTL